MTRSYEQEQSGIAERVKALKAILKKENTRLCTTDAFIEIVRRYTEAKELTGRMVTELVDHIEVYHAERVNGVITQKVVVHYNFIGAFEVPDWENIPDFDIDIETRKGVALRYSAYKDASVLTEYSNPIRTLRLVREGGLEPPRAYCTLEPETNQPLIIKPHLVLPDTVESLVFQWVENSLCVVDCKPLWL